MSETIVKPSITARLTNLWRRNKVLPFILLLFFIFFEIVSLYSSFQEDKEDKKIDNKLRSFKEQQKRSANEKTAFPEAKKEDLLSNPRVGLYKVQPFGTNIDYMIEGYYLSAKGVTVNNEKFVIINLARITQSRTPFTVVLPEKLLGAQTKTKPSQLISLENKVKRLQLRLHSKTDKLRLEDLQEWDVMTYFLN